MLRSLIHAIAITIFTAGSSLAVGMAKPEGQVLLTVSGNVEITNANAQTELDLGLLETLENRTIETSTIWTEGKQVFQGVPLNVLVDALGLKGTTLRATAINNYAVEIPMGDAVEGGPIVAYRLNGETMSVRDKGPLWIIYPYDSNADYRTEVIYSRSIWQLDRIEALD